jgi:hypothetical protein
MAVKSNISTNIAIGANLSGLTRGLKIASSKMRRFGNQAKSIGSTLSRGISLPLAALGAISVKTFSEFEAEMSKVKAVSGATEAQFKKLETQAKALGASTTFTASEVAGLQSEFAKLGFTADEIDKVTESTLFLAQAGGTELARAAEVAGATLRAFGLDAEETGRVTDVMASSFASSSLDMESFAEAMKTVAPIANATGVTLEEASGMLGALANNGVKGSIAGTALKKILSELHQEGKPLTKTIQELSDKNITLSEAEELVGERAKGALLILAEQKGTVDELTETFINADGAAQGMAETMMNNTAGAFKILQSTTEGALIEIGEAITENEVFKAVLEKLTVTISKITKHITGMTDAQQFNTVILAGLLALVPLVITAIGSLSLAFGSLTAAMGPVGIAVGAVVLAYQALKKEVTESEEVIKDALDSDSFVEAQEKLKQRLQEVNEQLKLRKEALERATNIRAKDAQQAAVNELEEERIKLLETLKGLQDENTESLKLYEQAMNEYAEEQRKAREETQKYNETLTILTSSIDRLQGVQLKAKDSLHRLGQKFVENSQKALNFTATTSEGLQQSIDLTSGLALEFSENLGNAIAGAIVNGDNFAESFITALKAMAAQLIATIALVAVLAALLIIATGGLSGLSFKGLLSAMKIVSKSTGITIPFLAEGGIVTSPTLAMIGEGGESEAVIPLSKLPQIAGANGGAVEVFGRISGEDILLSSERSSKRRTRFRGF